MKYITMKYIVEIERKVVEAVVVLFALYIMFVISGIAIRVVPVEYILPIGLAFVYFLGFLFFPTGSHEKLKNLIIDWFLAILGVFTALYPITVAYHISKEGLPMGLVTTFHEVLLGIIALILLLELVRRVAGIALLSLIILFLLLGFSGDYLPIAWLPKSLSIDFFSIFFYLGNLYYGSTEGLFGRLTNIALTVISGFLIFGGVMAAAGLGEFIIDLLQSLVGWARGGPAKVTIWASALFGTITGSPVAEVMVVGTITIPAMISAGFKPHVAAGIEAAAACGGELMPPIMGAGAFIMSEMIGVPYVRIAAAAIFPAILYFITKYTLIHFYAVKYDLKGLERLKLPKFRDVIAERWILFIPLVVLIAAIITLPSIMWAAFWSIIAALTIPNLKRSTRIKLNVLYEKIIESVKGIVSVSVMIIGADIITTVMVLTGLAHLTMQFTLSIAGNNLLLALIITMIGALVLGMIVPATPAYILAAVTFAPTLQRLGLDPLVAHMFIFYFAIMGPITPPVAIATFAASTIAKADFWRSGLWGTIFASTGFIVPFIFVYDPSLLLFSNSVNALIRFIFASLGFIVLAGVLLGYLFTPLNILQRILFTFISALLLYPDLSYRVNLVGLSIYLIFLMYYSIIKKR
jgi:TRAP transporter 4TM/12TM fusion protein